MVQLFVGFVVVKSSPPEEVTVKTTDVELFSAAAPVTVTLQGTYEETGGPPAIV